MPQDGESKYEASTYKFHEKASAVAMNARELCAQYLIICPLLTMTDEGLHKMRSVDLEYIKAWVKKSREALEDGGLVESVHEEEVGGKRKRSTTGSEEELPSIRSTRARAVIPRTR